MQAEASKKFVVLFQGDASENDNKYVNMLSESGIYVKNIPTLSFNFVNAEKLKNCLENADDYGGIIFTSSRAVNAVAFSLTSNSCLEKWKDKFIFSVGQATSEMAQSLLNLETCGSDSGNSENLCEIILQKCEKYNKPLLFPCSNIRKNTIPDTLSKHSIHLKEIVCYETVPNTQFKDVWTSLVEKENLPSILVFFSPSGVKYCSEIVMDSYDDAVKPNFVAIGSSTEKALLDVNVRSCKVAEKPNPEAVLSAVKDLLNY